MTAMLILFVLLFAAAAAPWLGTDSRSLDRGTWSRDALWSRGHAGAAPPRH